MPNFIYRARDPQGLLSTGELEASGVGEAEETLASRGLIPLSVKEAAKGFHFLQKGIFQKRVKMAEVLFVTRQFHSLFKAGMGMEEVLTTLAKQTNNKRLREALAKIRSSVSTGESLSKAFAAHQDIFGELYISMLAAGEEAGILEEVLANLCRLLEKEDEIKSSVKSALLYPKIVISVLVVASVVIMMVVVPKFVSFYGHYKAALPLPTRILIGMSNFIRDYWFLAILMGGGAWYGIKKYTATVRGKIKLGQISFRFPVFGSLNLKVANGRFCYILSALYRSGLPMNRCLEITQGTIENGAFMRDVDYLKGEVTRGKSIADGMKGCSYFTPVIMDATAVGERSGTLDEMLESMGGHYDMEVQHTIKNLTTLLEPFLLFAIFGMVALFALAIFLPIWNLSRAVSGGA